jgi:hypothetical protein
MKPTQTRRLEMLLNRKRGTTSWEIMFVCRTVCPHRRIADLKERGWTIKSERIEGCSHHRYWGTPPKGGK